MKFPTKVPNGISQKKRDHVGLILKKHKTKRQALKQATQSDPKSNQLLTLISSERTAPSATILSLFFISDHPSPKNQCNLFFFFFFFLINIAFLYLFISQKSELLKSSIFKAVQITDSIHRLLHNSYLSQLLSRSPSWCRRKRLTILINQSTTTHHIPLVSSPPLDLFFHFISCVMG